MGGISNSNTTFGSAPGERDLQCSLGSRDAPSQELGVGF